MVNTRGPLISLVEWNTGGHHLTYFVSYCRAFLELGCSVLALSPEAENVRKIIEGSLDESLLSRLRLVQMDGTNFPKVRPSILRKLCEQKIYAKRLLNHINSFEQQSGKPISLIFFSCLYEHQIDSVDEMLRTLKRPWSGLYLQAVYFRNQGPRLPGTETKKSIVSLFRDSNLKALAMLDGGVVNEVRDAALGKPVFVFPDLTDESIDNTHPLARKMRNFAKDSPLVVSIGHLSSGKGVGALARVALRPETSQFSFAFIGEVVWPLLSAEDKDALFAANINASNTYYLGMRIPDGVRYNAILSACDVIYAAYIDFAHSSNTLTKAALIRKPIIVSEGHEMARRVREYRLGEVVTQNDEESIINAIHTITDDYEKWVENKQPRWDDYLQAHSHSALLSNIRGLLEASGVKLT